MIMNFTPKTAASLLLLSCPQVFVLADVFCGGHRAATCMDCPQGNGAAWCNGDCRWDDGTSTCITDVVMCAGGVTTTKCDFCPSCSDGIGDCSVMPRTSLCRDNFSDEIRTASVHLFYDKPTSMERPAWWFQKVTPISLSDATFFSTSGHSFGYGGYQKVDENTGSVIFSIWDQGDCDRDFEECDSSDVATTVACGEGVTCKDFGGEGTGRKSILYKYTDAFPAVGESYYMMTQARYVGNYRMEWTGYFYDNDEEKWRLMSRIQVSTNENEKWWIDGLYSFVEQWTKGHTTTERSAFFGPSFMSEDGVDFAPVTSARFAFGTPENHEHVNAWQAGEANQCAVAIGTGGDLPVEANQGESFSYCPESSHPLLDGFIPKINCLSDSTDKVSIEACLLDVPETPAPVVPATPAPAPVSEVSCGGHYAATCFDCPQGNGAVWCNGECTWSSASSTCVNKADVVPETPAPVAPETPAPEPASEVSCGGHYASLCYECPQGNGAAWCNGECTWSSASSICVSKAAIVFCGGHYAATCMDCPEGNGAAWCNGDCLWDEMLSMCVDKGWEVRNMRR